MKMKTISYLVCAIAILSMRQLSYAQSTGTLNKQQAYSSKLKNSGLNIMPAADKWKNNFWTEKLESSTGENDFRQSLSTYGLLSATNNFNPAGFKLISVNLIPGALVKVSPVAGQTGNKSSSFFSKNLFYFIGAAAIAVTVYLIWPKKEAPANSNTTFGVPPLPH